MLHMLSEKYKLVKLTIFRSTDRALIKLFIQYLLCIYYATTKSFLRILCILLAFVLCERYIIHVLQYVYPYLDKCYVFLILAWRDN